jgi:copper chaperone CopZ
MKEMPMRRWISRAVALAAVAALPLLSACSDDGAAANASAGAAEATAADEAGRRAPAGLARAEFDVAGMDCGGCVIGTRAALRKLEGVQQADASYDGATGEGTAWAIYDPAKVTPERMMEAIRTLGYTPTVAEG